MNPAIKDNRAEWEVVIGLEVHVQLATNSKIFSGAATTYGAEPNTQACAVDLALPGTLPVLNKEALAMAVKFGLSIDATINHCSVFARKNYFYPDLPKGYQISQFEHPIVGPGTIDIPLAEDQTKTIGVTRAHLEEDAGKSMHDALPGITGIDLNRAGTPLLEVVSEPDLRSSKEAVAYLKTLHSLVRYLEICDGNMQEGSFRCDANISVRKKGADKLGTRSEIKNVNSFRYVERAIEFEIDRQIDILEDGGKIVQETRLYDPQKDETRSMRVKEEAHDYRYFPDPDLLPVVITDPYIEQIRSQLPELPWQKTLRLQTQYQLSKYDANFLTSSRELADFFEQTCQQHPDTPAKLTANWLAGDVSAALNREGKTISNCPITPAQLAQLTQRIHDQTISSSAAKKVFTTLWTDQGDVDSIIKKLGLQQMNNDEELLQIVKDVIANNPGQVDAYRNGKDKLFGFFVGQVMKATQGRANPNQVNTLLRSQLDNK